MHFKEDRFSCDAIVFRPFRGFTFFSIRVTILVTCNLRSTNLNLISKSPCFTFFCSLLFVVELLVCVATIVLRFVVQPKMQAHFAVCFTEHKSYCFGK